ncbi:MAG: ATP-binding protein [Vicinamibacteria bacterium]|nr:ATP-binding protein [Vicinamibacteria bacterium]
MEARYLQGPVEQDLAAKMVFVSGPRQVGKTTLARQVLARSGAAGEYLSWDNRQDRAEIRAARWPGGRGLVVLDEIHKWRGWKRWLKGEFDRHRDHVRFLVTGSARLDVYRRGGDSLQGRYHHYRLHPFSFAEAADRASERGVEPGEELPIPPRADPGLVTSLLRYGGFPEPFLAQSERGARRWRKERLERFFREDVRDLEPLRDLASFELFASLLPQRVGSPLSLNALREDLEVSHRAATHWANVLDALYYSYRIRPFGAPAARTLKKAPKAYLWDWTLVDEPAARFENLLASHLLKFCHFLNDHGGFAVDLHYLRDRDGREVDFLVTRERKPWFAVEAKLSERRVDPALRSFRERLRIPFCYQVTREEGRDVLDQGVRVVPASRFLGALF